MTELENRINEVIGLLVPTSKTAKAMSSVKQTLNASSHIVTAVNNFGDSLQNNLEGEVGGVVGSVGGWIAGKSTKLVGGIAGGVIAGTLKTVAGIIPDSSDIKLPETDRKVAHAINTYPLPSEKIELFNLLQYLWGEINSEATPFGKLSITAFKSLYPRVHAAFLIAARQDAMLLEQAKSYAPKKRFGIF